VALRFLKTLRPWFRTGMALWIGMAAIVLGMPSASAGGDDVMMPDCVRPTPTPAPTVGPHGGSNAVTATKKKSAGVGNGNSYTCERSRTSITVYRNGKLWVTLTPQKGSVGISDPNGTGKVILTVAPTH
jgi:hypothetical protein